MDTTVLYAKKLTIREVKRCWVTARPSQWEHHNFKSFFGKNFPCTSQVSSLKVEENISIMKNETVFTYLLTTRHKT